MPRYDLFPPPGLYLFYVSRSVFFIRVPNLRKEQGDSVPVGIPFSPLSRCDVTLRNSGGSNRHAFLQAWDSWNYGQIPESGVVL
jgi:hypothetical protein